VTKSGGWRTSGALSCPSKPMVDKPVSERASRKSLLAVYLRGEKPRN
jgi:hypothetical protein